MNSKQLKNLHGLPLLAICAGLIAPTLVFAEQHADATTERVTRHTPEWQMNCDAKQRCELSIVIEDHQGPVSHLLVYDAGKTRLVEYLVPLRVNLQKGVKILIDRKQQFETKPLYCDTAGCVGYSPLNVQLLSAMRAGKTLELVFQAVNEQQAYAVPITLSGFTAKLKSLPVKSMQQKSR